MRRDEALARAKDALHLFLTDPTIIKDDEAILRGEEAIAALDEVRRGTPDVNDVANDVFHFLNVMGNSDVPELVYQLTWKQHRTIQQTLFRDLIVPIIKEFAQMADEGRYDARNEGTVRAARRLRHALESEPTPLPFV